MFTRAPVAISALPNPTCSRVCSFAVRSPASSDITLVSVSSSTSFSRYQSAPLTYASDSWLSPRRYSFDSGGRSYGTCGSRPTRRIEPSAPRRRSVAAQCAAAMPPPTSRKSTSRSAIGRDPSPADPVLAAVRPVRPEVSLQLLLHPRIQDREHLVARLQDRLQIGHESRPVPQHRDEQAPLRQLEIRDP